VDKNKNLVGRMLLAAMAILPYVKITKILLAKLRLIYLLEWMFVKNATKPR
jgi:hypothetical protein